ELAVPLGRDGRSRRATAPPTWPLGGNPPRRRRSDRTPPPGDRSRSARRARTLRDTARHRAPGDGAGRDRVTSRLGIGALPGGPLVGILAEYDALPGLSQQAGEAKKDPRTPDAPGHGCGHNLLGTSAVAAAVAANQARISQKLPGTIKVFGTPAEEILIGKT